MSKSEKALATLTIHEAARLTKRGRKRIADWLRAHAIAVESDGHNYSTRFTGRYFAGRPAGR